jgi:hypothetical protein
MSLIGLLGGGYFVFHYYREKRLYKRFESKYQGDNKQDVWNRYNRIYNKNIFKKLVDKVKENYKERKEIWKDAEYGVIDDIDWDDY